MQDENEPTVRPEQPMQPNLPFGPPSPNPEPRPKPEPTADEIAAAKAADRLLRREEAIRESYPEAFASNKNWVSARSRGSSADPNIQPHECWRLDQPRGRL